MKKAMLLLVFALATYTMFLSTANAQITATITIKDYKGNIINDKTVHIGTTAYIHGHYEDQAGNSPASVQMDVFYDGGSGYTHKATIWSGSLEDGETVIETYTMSEPGSYQFRMTCETETPDSVGALRSGAPRTLGIQRCEEIAQARTTIQLVTPEPGTLAGLAMALTAFGLLAVKRKRAKQ